MTEIGAPEEYVFWTPRGNLPLHLMTKDELHDLYNYYQNANNQAFYGSLAIRARDTMRKCDQFCKWINLEIKNRGE